MLKSLVALAILSAASAPAVAQTAPAAQPSQAKPQMIKKRICHQEEEDSYSRLGGRKICKTVEVPADQAGDHQNQQNTQANSSERG